MESKIVTFYTPEEDSYFLEKYVTKYARGLVLDIGTGSGILAGAAAEKKNVTGVIAVDISKDAIAHCRQTNTLKKIRFAVSDMFGHTLFRRGKKMRFDTIICNPPYLPADSRYPDAALDGGRHGHEFIERLMQEAGNYLTKNGTILLLFSSQTNRQKVDEIIARNLFTAKLCETQKLFFEALYVYRITKHAIRRELEKKGMGDISYFAKGHRGLLFTARYRKKKIVAKIKNPQSTASQTVIKEAQWMRFVNSHGIGPRYLFGNRKYVAYEFAEGLFFESYVRASSKQKIVKFIKDIFYQMRKLDTLGIVKEEMHHPYKHVVVPRNGRPVLLDFERCHASARPKNVTQFCQCVASKYLEEIFKSKGIIVKRTLMRQYAQQYKPKLSEKYFQKILFCIGYHQRIE